jgi:lipocalin-like protein
MSADAIIGTWGLADYFLEGAPEDGVRPLGDDPLGRLIYAPDGYMAVEYMPRDRPPLATPWRWAGDAERLAAARDYGGYSGRYEWLGDRVLHHVESGVHPNWIGTTLVRRAVLDGSRLTLRAVRSPHTPPTPVLVWERLTGGPGGGR